MRNLGGNFSMEFSLVRPGPDERHKVPPRFVAGEPRHLCRRLFLWTVRAASPMIRRGTAGTNEDNHEAHTRCENSSQCGLGDEREAGERLGLRNGGGGATRANQRVGKTPWRPRHAPG